MSMSDEVENPSPTPLLALVAALLALVFLVAFVAYNLGWSAGMEQAREKVSP